VAEPRTYNPALLTNLDVTNLDFVRTWVRTLLRDKPEVETGGVPLPPGQPTRPRAGTWPEFSRSDTEIDAALALDAVQLETVIYYRPHFTAARLYLGDPSLWRTRAVDGSSESRRDAAEITGAWLAQGAALDRLIPAELYPLPAFVTVSSTATSGVTPDTGPFLSAIPLIIGGL
jgi:hypothetical protein